jgi:hypothetical protein
VTETFEKQGSALVGQRVRTRKVLVDHVLPYVQINAGQHVRIVDFDPEAGVFVAEALGRQFRVPAEDLDVLEALAEVGR